MNLQQHKQKVLEEFDIENKKTLFLGELMTAQGKLLSDAIKAFISQAIDSTAERTKEALKPDNSNIDQTKFLALWEAIETEKQRIEDNWTAFKGEEK